MLHNLQFWSDTDLSIGMDEKYSAAIFISGYDITSTLKTESHVFQNFDIRLQVYILSQPRRPELELSAL
jgi:hypothetical protein